MTTPEPPPEGAPQRSRASHRAQPAPRSRVIPIVAALAVIAALALAAYMLLTSNDNGDEGTTPPVTHSPTVSATPTGGNNNGGGNGNNNGGGNGNNNGGGNGNNNGGGNGNNNGGGNGNNNGGGNGNNNGGGNHANKPVPQIPVYVFNQTTITGLAQQTASRLEVAGWNVAGVDNWIGHVPQDTVYYWPGDKAAAERLSHDFFVGRVWPASSPMPQNALTLILATTDRK